MNPIPSVMFTFNPRMNLEQILPKSDDLVRQAIGIDSQFMKQTLENVYIGADTKETRCFVSEGPDLVRLFFRLYDSLQDALVFNDGGNFWKPWGSRTECTQLQCINIFHQPTTDFTERPSAAGGRHVMTLLTMFIARSSSFIVGSRYYRS